MRYRALIIDDDRDLCRLLAKCLEAEGVGADCVHEGLPGLSRLDQREYHLVILDVMLPDSSGFDLLPRIRREHRVPVLMLTARDSEPDKVAGLRLGADDYLTKPFGIAEFSARASAMIRRYTALGARAASMESTGRLEHGPLALDRLRRSASVGGSPLELTGKEFDLLWLLAESPGRVYTKKQLYRQVWREEYLFDDGNVMAFISKLRKKLEAAGGSGLIQTIRGVGYRLSKGESV